MKKKLLSLMVVMSLVVSMTLGVTGCGSKSSDSDKKVLKVAFECAYAPYNWTQESPEVGNGKQAVKIKNADGYAYGYEVELAQRYEKGRYVPYACGTHTKVSPAYISGSKKTFAFKFEPGVIPDFMKEYVSDIVCDRKCLAYIDDIQNISSMLQNEDDFEKMVDIFMDNLRYDRHFADKKNIIASIAGIIHKGKGNINIAKIAEGVGYNQRYLDRVFKEAVGVSMKKYAEIIRIQKAIYYLQNSLTYEIYERLGYYDQAHFIKDFKKNTSLTTSRFERANSQYKIV